MIVFMRLSWVCVLTYRLRWTIFMRRYLAIIGLSMAIPWVNVARLIGQSQQSPSAFSSPSVMVRLWTRLFSVFKMRVTTRTLWKGRPLPKASDLGRPSTNLQRFPNKEQKKQNQLVSAISNLASTEPPSRLLPLPPSKLFGESKEQ